MANGKKKPNIGEVVKAFVDSGALDGTKPVVQAWLKYKTSLKTAQKPGSKTWEQIVEWFEGLFSKPAKTERHFIDKDGQKVLTSISASITLHDAETQSRQTYQLRLYYYRDENQLRLISGSNEANDSDDWVSLM